MNDLFARGGMELASDASMALVFMADLDAEAIIQPCHTYNLPEITMQWTKPEYTDLRFGFEITMYIANR